MKKFDWLFGFIQLVWTAFLLYCCDKIEMQHQNGGVILALFFILWELKRKDSK